MLDFYTGQICEPCSESALPAVPQQVQPSTSFSFYSFSPASLVLQALQKKQRVGWWSVQIGYLGIIMEIHSKYVINQSDSGKPNEIPLILCWKHSRCRCRCTRLEVIGRDYMWQGRSSTGVDAQVDCGIAIDRLDPLSCIAITRHSINKYGTKVSFKNY